MKRLSFLDKTKELLLYTDRYETVTLFEISQLYGSALCAFLVFCFGLPLLVFSTMWVALPLTFVCLILSTLMLFDEGLWMIDSIKAVTLASPAIKKIVGPILKALESLKARIPAASFYEQYSTIFRKANPIVMIVAAFLIGFIQSPDTSILTVFSLLLVSLGSVIDDGYLCLAGYTAFLLGLI